MHGFSLQLRLCQGLIQGRDTDWKQPISTLHSMLYEIWSLICSHANPDQVQRRCQDKVSNDGNIFERTDDDPKEEAKYIAKRCFVAGGKLRDEDVTAYVNSGFSCSKSDLSGFKRNLIEEIYERRRNVEDFGAVGKILISSINELSLILLDSIITRICSLNVIRSNSIHLQVLHAMKHDKAISFIVYFSSCAYRPQS